MPNNKEIKSSYEETVIKEGHVSKSEHDHDVEAGFTFKTKNNILAIISLVLSCSFVILGPAGLLTCIPGIICGHIAIKQCKEDPSLRGRGFAIAGMITGYAFLGLCVLGVILFIGGCTAISVINSK